MVILFVSNKKVWFTLLYFASQVVTQVRWVVSYTYDLMYQLFLYVVYSCHDHYSIFPEFIFQWK